MFRMVVQESRLTPTSGKVVALLGSYDPHAKAVTLDKEKASLYLKNGAQPSDRVARLLKSEGVKLPEWVKITEGKKRTTRNPEKLRKNQPKEEAPVEAEAPAEPAEAPAEGAATEAAEEPKEA